MPGAMLTGPRFQLEGMVRELVSISANGTQWYTMVPADP